MTEQQRARLEIMSDPESPRHGLRPSDCEAVRAALEEIDQLKAEIQKRDIHLATALAFAGGTTGIP